MEIQWLRHCTSTAVSMCSIPHRGTKILHAVQLGQKIEINKVKYKIKMGGKDSTDISSKYFRYDYILYTDKGFPGGSEVKAAACNAGDLGSIPGLGRSPGEGNGNPLQYSCLENLIDGGAWWATVHEVAKSRPRLSDFTSYTDKIYLSRCKTVKNQHNFSHLKEQQFRTYWVSLVAQMVKNLYAMQETQIRSLSQEDPLEKGMATHSSILAWRIP